MRWLFDNPLLAFCLRPWFDGAALRFVTSGYLPLARAAAAAVDAEGDADCFWSELPARPGAGATRLPLEAVVRAHRRYTEAELQWEQSFFRNATSLKSAGLPALEKRRRRAAGRMMRSCGAFLPLAIRRPLPKVKWEVAGPQAVAARHSERLKAREHAFPAPSIPPVERSLAMPGSSGDEYWLRFPSPRLAASTGENANDVAWAHVYEPAAPQADRPSLIFLHGLFMEPELWPDSQDPLPLLTSYGVRVVRCEGPWHGRRRMPGRYGGEPVLARGPLGLLDLVEAWVAELAVLVAWARQTSAGPVAIGGLSLGALASQMAVAAAAHWPAALRPDAALLVATSADLLDVLERGSLSAALGLPRELAAAGWTREELAHWLLLAVPLGDCGVPPERIVMVLGSADRVTPFAGGRALADRWHVPQQNRFISARGHFSAALAAIADDAPLRRLLGILGAARGREG